MCIGLQPSLKGPCQGLSEADEKTEREIGDIKSEYMLWCFRVPPVEFRYCQQMVHCTTDCLGLSFRGFQILASACALHLPTIKV